MNIFVKTVAIIVKNLQHQQQENTATESNIRDIMKTFIFYTIKCISSNIVLHS